MPDEQAFAKIVAVDPRGADAMALLCKPENRAAELGNTRMHLETGSGPAMT